MGNGVLAAGMAVAGAGAILLPGIGSYVALCVMGAAILVGPERAALAQPLR